MARFAREFQEFLKSLMPMQIIHSRKLNIPMTGICYDAFDQKVEQNSNEIEGSPIYVLDSSFNPPHYGHLELINRAVTLQKGKPGHVVLLLSITNADKAPAPAAFDQRLDMMYELGEYLLGNTPINNSINQYSLIMSKSPRFIDKSMELNRIYPRGLKHYLMGFDTLIRVFDQKYYTAPIAEELEDFVTRNKFVCLTRDKEINDQLKYLQQLKTGQLNLPSHWANYIELVVNELDNSVISSSSIRNTYKSARELVSLLESRTMPPIKRYIEDNNLYF